MIQTLAAVKDRDGDRFKVEVKVEAVGSGERGEGGRGGLYHY